MNATPDKPVSPFTRAAAANRWRFTAGLVATIVLAGLMPTGESLWIDEAVTLRFAAQPSLSGLAELFRSEKCSEVQMPLGMLAFWSWEKLAGRSEWAMRAMNIGWALLAAWALFLTGKRCRLPLLPLWFIVQPFLWFYANEARPYVMQIAGAAWLLHGMIACIRTRAAESLWAVSFIVGALLTAGASMLGAVPVFSAFALTAGWLVVIRARPSRRAILLLVAGALLLAPLGLYYLQTLKQGAGGAKHWNVGWGNAGFAGYELAGFLGLGPARLEIRDAARSGSEALIALFKPFGPGLGTLAFLYLLLLPPLTKGRPPSRAPEIVLAVLHVVLTVGLLLAASRAVGFPFWGRHLAPLSPFVALLIAWHADRFARAAPFPSLARLVPALLVVLLLASSLTLRFSNRHRKEDYRHAVQLALGAVDEGLRIGWAADVLAARYYGVTFTEPRGNERLFHVRPAPPDSFEADLAGFPPDGIMLSKPDLFDPQGRLTRWLHAHRYQPLATFPGFTFWVKPSPSL